MPSDDFLDVWACVQGGLFGPHAEYIRAINLVGTIEAMNANLIAVNGQKPKKPRDPKEIVPGYIEFLDIIEDKNPHQKMMEALNGGL